MTANFGFFTAILITPAVILPVAVALSQDIHWQPVPIRADWTDHDYGCSQGATPSPRYCDANHLGNVAVCWDNRPTGECGGARAWCTYKAINISTPPHGGSPGRVYVCE